MDDTPTPPDMLETTSGTTVRSGSKLLVCVDASPEAQVALTLTARKAAKRGDALEILHVMEPEAEMQGLFSVADRMREERRAEGEALLQSLAERCQRLAGLTPSLQLKEGRVGDVVLSSVLEDADVTMLVLGAGTGSGRGTLLNWLSAQLGDRLLVPLMVVPGNLTDQQMDALI